jgi:uncharacterized protein
MINRRTALKLLGGTGIAAIAGHAIWIEPEQLQVERYNLADRPPFRPSDVTLRLVQVSDLHLKKIDGFAQKVATAVNQLKPDLIVLTGDIIDRARNLPLLDQFLAMLDPAPAKYAILGNWENYAGVNQTELRTLYDRYNCPLLINASLIHEHQGRKLLITGLDDTVEGTPNLEQAMTGAKPQPNHLILAHAPDQHDLFSNAEIARLQPFQPQLMLSGHTHAGQITFLGWRPVLPRGSGRYVQGWYGDNSTLGLPLYVSRGIGGSGIRARLGSVPEVALFEWPLQSAS